MSGVSVIICTKDRCGFLERTLDSLMDVGVPAGMSVEVLVVDNGSSDGTVAMVEGYAPGAIPIRCISEPNGGQAAARNAGIAATEADIIVFTDDDLRYPAPWLAALCSPIASGVADAVAGGVVMAPELEREWMTAEHRAALACSVEIDPDQPNQMIGANFAFSRRVLGKVPGFDEELGPGARGFFDDTLFSWQIRQAGFRIATALDSPVVHHFDPSRLARSSWANAAQCSGASNAYVTHHWKHESIPAPLLSYARALVRYAGRRSLRWRECRSAEGMPEWEFVLRTYISRLRTYLAERKRPRLYGERGLAKLARS